MKWCDFLNLILDEKQINILKYSLKLNARVHFYGVGIGKGTVVAVLRNAGYFATEPADIEPCISCDTVPNDSTAICFNIKTNNPKSIIVGLYDDLRAQTNEIKAWVNTY